MFPTTEKGAEDSRQIRRGGRTAKKAEAKARKDERNFRHGEGESKKK